MSMLSGIIDTNAVIVIAGAVAILVAAFLMFKSDMKKGRAKVQTETQETPVPENAMENVPALQGKTADKKSKGDKKNKESTRKSSSIRNTRREIVRKMRAIRRPGIILGRKVANESPGTEEELPEPFPVDIAPGFRASAPLPSDEPEAPDGEPVNDDKIEDSSINEPLLETEQPLPDTGITDEGQDETAMPASLFSDSTEINGEQAPEEITLLADEMEQGAIATDDSDPEQEKSGGSMFDLFAEESIVENETSKFAANLNEVDIHHLLADAQDLINRLGGRVR